jgi:predicted esterase
MEALWKRPVVKSMIVWCVLGLICTVHADQEYVSFTTGDSLRLAACTQHDYIWRGNIDCSYKTLTPKSGLPIATLMLFHGSGDNAANFTKIAARIDTSRINHVLVQAPVETAWYVDDPATGEVTAYQGYSWVADESSWVDGGLSLSLYLVERVFERVISPNQEELPPIFLLGFRQGAGVAAAWAASHRELVRGMILVSGYADPVVDTILDPQLFNYEGLPCLSIIGTEALDALDSAGLSSRMRELGADLEVKFMNRDAQFSPRDYDLIREFILDHSIPPE